MVTRRKAAPADPWARERLELREMLAPDQDHYARLETTYRGVQQGDWPSLAEGRSKIARRAHPDRYAAADVELQQLAHDVMSAANVAYETLTDVTRHRKYRAGLLKTHRECEVCAGKGETLRKRGFTGGNWVLCNACEGSGLMPKEKK